MTWELVTPDGSLVELSDPSAVRLIAGAPGNYGLRATDANGEVGTFGFTVVSSQAQLTVSEVVGGTDDDDVEARIATSGDDIFIAERIGDEIGGTDVLMVGFVGGKHGRRHPGSLGEGIEEPTVDLVKAFHDVHRPPGEAGSFEHAAF